MTEDLETSRERARIESTLQQTDNQFWQMVQHTPDIIAVGDAQGTILYASPSVERILGYRTEEYIGANGAQYIHPDDLDRVVKAAQEVAARPGIHTQAVTWRHRHADGSWRVLEGLANNLLTHPKVRGIVYNARDVTEASRLNEAVHRQASILRGQAELLDLANDAILVHDRYSGQVLYWNEGAETLYGWMKREAVGKRTHDLLHTKSLRPLEEIEQELLKSDRWEGELTQTRRDGTPIVVCSRWTLRRGADGEPTAILQVNSDITEQKRTEEALRQSEAEFRSIFEQAGVGIARLDLDGRLLNTNPALDKLLGYAREELIGRAFAKFAHPDDLAVGLDLYGQLVAGQHDYYQIEKRFLHKDGHLVWGLLTITLVRDSEGMPRYAVAHIEEVTERKATEDRLAHRALHDPLTDLPNRVLFMHHLTQALARTMRHHYTVGVLFLDLDMFKAINDEFGHATGDALLMTAAARIKQCLRSEDTAARLGGDEFVIVLPDIAGIEDAASVAKRIIAEMQTPFGIDGFDARIGASIGIALSSSKTNDPAELLQQADLAMYQAKRAGRGRWQMYHPPEEIAVPGSDRLDADLPGALDRGEFRMQFEPWPNPGTDTVAGIAARLYWEHPERGLLETDDFLPIAADLGLSTAIEVWLLETACRRAKEWQELYPASEMLAVWVDLSARCLEAPGFVGDIERLLADIGLASHHLVIRVTDDASLSESGDRGIVRSLTGLGLRIAERDHPPVPR